FAGPGGARARPVPDRVQPHALAGLSRDQVALCAAAAAGGAAGRRSEVQGHGARRAQVAAPARHGTRAVTPRVRPGWHAGTRVAGWRGGWMLEERMHTSLQPTTHAALPPLDPAAADAANALDPGLLATSGIEEEAAAA